MLINCYCCKKISIFFFIDYEGFVDNNDEYMIKELCIMNVDNMFNPLHYVFE
jgi:hypothetical protein